MQKGHSFIFRRLTLLCLLFISIAVIIAIITPFFVITLGLVFFIEGVILAILGANFRIAHRDRGLNSLFWDRTTLRAVRAEQERLAQVKPDDYEERAGFYTLLAGALFILLGIILFLWAYILYILPI